MKSIEKNHTQVPTEEKQVKIGFLKKIRKWFEARLGQKPKPIPEDPQKEEHQSQKHFREEVPELRPKKVLPTSPLKPESPAETKKPQPKPSTPQNEPAPASKPAPNTKPPKERPSSKIPLIKKVPDLSHISDEEMVRRLTGDTSVAATEARKFMTPTAEVMAEKRHIPTRPITKREILKDYPQNPQEEIDLHGKKAIEAEREMTIFIRKAKGLSLRLVRIITGKGLHSEHGRSILGEMAEKRVLELKKQNLIFDHKWEKGKGAMLVYLT